MNNVLADIQAVVDKLQSEGHTVATKLENALKALLAHFKSAETVAQEKATEIVEEAQSDAKALVEEAKPVVADAVAKGVTVASEVVKDVAEVKDAAKK